LSTIKNNLATELVATKMSLSNSPEIGEAFKASTQRVDDDRAAGSFIVTRNSNNDVPLSLRKNSVRLLKNSFALRDNIERVFITDGTAGTKSIADLYPAPRSQPSYTVFHTRLVFLGGYMAAQQIGVEHAFHAASVSQHRNFVSCVAIENFSDCAA
jgi:hypothetical protein